MESMDGALDNDRFDMFSFSVCVFDDSIRVRIHKNEYHARMHA